MSKVSWVFGLLQGHGIDTTGMNLDRAFAELEKLRKSGAVTDDQIKFSKSHSSTPSSKGTSSKTNAPDSQKTSIKEQVKANQEKLKDTKVLAVIPKGKMTTDFKTAATVLRAKLAKNGGIVSREGFGDVQVGSRLKEARAYIKTAAEVAAVSAVPAVIQKGTLISEHENHKGRDFVTYTFAGKVSIAGQNGVVAVVVKKTTGKFYKVHRILTPDGKDLKIENDTD